MKVNGKMVKHYNKFGYNVKQYDIIDLDVKHLTKYSHQKILCACDICGEQKLVKYNNYCKYISNDPDNIYTCKKCNLEKRKNTCLEKYGKKFVAQTDFSKEKQKETCLKKYGVEYPLQSKKIRKKIRKTCLERYGVENPSQDPEIHKRQHSGHILKYYNENLTYRGSYEKDFLDYCFENNIEIENFKGNIEYELDSKSRKYFPDFYMKKYNLIIEIKSSYTYNIDYDENIAKKEAAISNGFNFLFIIDKDYSEFNLHLC